MEKPHKVFITRKIDQSAIQRLQAICDVEIWPEELPPPHDLLCEKASRVNGLLTLLTDPIDSQVIKAGNNCLKVISQMAVGFDNIDIKAATAAGIPVGHTPGILTETTADFTWALLSAAARRIAEADKEVRQHIWRPWGPDVLCGYDLFGATIGIIGFGRIGQAVARRAKGFNMRILYSDPEACPEAEQLLGAQHVSIEYLLQESDFVSLHVYLSPSTRGMIGSAQFKMMKPNAILINTSRGAVIDTNALVTALETNTIAAVALDVFDPEPIPTDNPLLKLPNVVITPHIASASRQTRQKMAEIAVDNLLAGLSGKTLPFCANPNVYTKQELP